MFRSQVQSGAAPLSRRQTRRLLFALTTIFFITVGQTSATASEKSWWKAVEKGKTSKVEKLLRKGADVDLVNESGQTGLVVSAARGHLDLVRLLIGQGADVNHGPDDATPLVEAIRGGHISVVQELIVAGADVNHGSDDATPLAKAVRSGHPGIVRELIDAGADVNQLVMRVAEQKGSQDVLAVLAPHAPVAFSASMQCGNTVVPDLSRQAYFSMSTHSAQGETCSGLYSLGKYLFEQGRSDPRPIQLRLRYAPGEVTFSSTDPEIITIRSGKTVSILAKSSGTALVEGKADGETIFRLNVIVVHDEVWKIALDQDEGSID